MFAIVRRAAAVGVRWFLVTLIALGVVGCGSQPAAAPAQPAPAPAPAAKPAAPPIKIAIVGPMAFPYGDHMWKAAGLAAEEVNAGGGVQVGDQKRLIELAKVDTNEILSVPDAASAVERAITRDKVDFVVGGARSEAVLAMQDVTADHKKIFLNIGAGDPAFTQRVADNYEKYKYTFRPNPMNTKYVGQVSFLMLADVAGIVRKELGVEKPRVAIFVEKIQTFEALVAAAEKTIPTMGMEVAGVWRPSATATDVTAELSAIAAAKPHIIFTALTGPVGVVYARQWEDLKIPAASVGVNVEAQGGSFLKSTGGKGNYEATINLLGRAAVTDKAIPFFDKFVARYGEVPLHHSASYDGVRLLAEAVGKVGSLDAGALIAELEKTDFKGVTGRIVFGKDHDVTWGPGYVTGFGTQWQDGKPVVFWPNGWKDVRYEGSVKYALPPWVVAHWKK